MFIGIEEYEILKENDNYIVVQFKDEIICDTFYLLKDIHIDFDESKYVIESIYTFIKRHRIAVCYTDFYYNY